MAFELTARNCLLLANRLGASLDGFFRKTNSTAAEALFVVGLPRSGTTLAYELLVQAFAVAYFPKIYNYTFGAPNLTTRLFSSLIKRPRAYYRSNYGSIPGALSPAENHNFWLKWFPEDPQLGHYVNAESVRDRDTLDMNSVLASISGIVGLPFVFKDVYLTLAIDAVLQKIEHSKVLIITRDRESVAASVFRRRTELQDVRDWWSIRPPFADQVIGGDLVEQVAFQCVRSEQILERQLAHADPSRYRVVDYAAICTSTHAFIKQMSDWLGPTFQPRKDSSIPLSFGLRPSTGFPNGLGQSYAQHEASFRADGDQYLRLVDAQSVANRSSTQLQA